MGIGKQDLVRWGREGEPSEAGRHAAHAGWCRGCSARLEEKNSDLAKVEIDEVLGLVGHI